MSRGPVRLQSAADARDAPSASSQPPDTGMLETITALGTAVAAAVAAVVVVPLAVVALTDFLERASVIPLRSGSFRGR